MAKVKVKVKVKVSTTAAIARELWCAPDGPRRRIELVWGDEWSVVIKSFAEQDLPVKV